MDWSKPFDFGIKKWITHFKSYGSKKGMQVNVYTWRKSPKESCTSQTIISKNIHLILEKVTKLEESEITDSGGTILFVIASKMKKGYDI